MSKSPKQFVTKNWKKLALTSQFKDDNTVILWAIYLGWWPESDLTDALIKQIAGSAKVTSEKVTSVLSTLTHKGDADALLEQASLEAGLKSSWTAWADEEEEKARSPSPARASTGGNVGAGAGQPTAKSASPTKAAPATATARAPKPRDPKYELNFSSALSDMLNSNERAVRQAGVELTLQLMTSRTKVTRGDITAAATRQSAVAEHYTRLQAPSRGPKTTRQRQVDPEEARLRAQYQQSAGANWASDPGYRAAIRELRARGKQSGKGTAKA